MGPEPDRPSYIDDFNQGADIAKYWFCRKLARHEYTKYEYTG